MYTVILNPRAKKQFHNLPSKIQRTLAVIVDRLETEAIPAEAKKLLGKKDTYRIRSGQYRIIYQIDNDKLIILVIGVGHRQGIYNHL